LKRGAAFQFINDAICFIICFSKTKNRIHEWVNFWTKKGREDMIGCYDPSLWSQCGTMRVHVRDALWTEGGQNELMRSLQNLPQRKDSEDDLLNE